MTKKEKRDNARNRVVQKIVDNVLILSGACEVVEGPRGPELLELMRKETWMLLADFEENYVKKLEDE